MRLPALLLSLSFLAACSSPTDPPSIEEAPPLSAVPQPREDILVIVIDTLRADTLLAVDSPHIDSLPQRVDTAWSGGTWTVPSVISLFTGASVREHGFDLSTGRMGKYPQLPGLPTLAEVLKAEGFTTTGLYSNSYLAEELGFDRGFDTWRRVSDKVMAKSFRQTVEQTWAEGQRDFAYLHLLGPHSPLKPSAERQAKYGVDDVWFDERMGLEIGVAKRNRREGAREAYAQAYKAVIEDTDDIIGELLAALGERRDDTLVVITSDHGELLGEHNVCGHGYWAWEGLTHVPLRVEGHSGQLPAVMGLPAVADLITWNAGIEHDWPEKHTEPLPLVSQREGKLAMSPDGQLKGVWHTEALEVYDLAADPTEQSPLTGQDGTLNLLRAKWEAEVPVAAPLELVVELEPETVEGLKELGYIE
jgi:hypothetical protein